MITVNVGGTLYSTTAATLTKVEGSLLAELFNGDVEDGAEKFIDRDGACFRWVLNYLRSPAGTPTVLPEHASERAQLALEADFYGLPELAALCAKSLHRAPKYNYNDRKQLQRSGEPRGAGQTVSG